MQLLTIIIAIITFLVFYVLLRTLLMTEWVTQLSLLLLAILPDFLVQTNSTIPEAFSLIYLPLAFFLIIKLIRTSFSRLSLSTCLGLTVVFLYYSHHWTTMLFIIGSIAMLIGILLIRTHNLRIGILSSSLPALFCLGLILLFDPFSTNLFRLYFPIVMIFGIFTFASIIIMGYRGPILLDKILTVGKKIQMKYYFFGGFLISAASLIIVLSFYPISRSLLWQLWRFAPLTIIIGFAFVSFFHVLGTQRPIKLAHIFLICWLILLSLMFIGGFLLTLSDPTSWYRLSFIATMTHRLSTYIIIVAVPLASIGIALMFGILGIKSHTINYSLKKSTVLGIIGIIGVTSTVGVWNVYYPVGGWHQPWFTQTETQAAYWLSFIHESNSIIYLDARVRWLFYGTSPNSISNQTYSIINPEQFPIIPSGCQNIFYFISNLMEQKFMVDFSSQPIQVQLRSILDIESRFIRIYDSAALTIYSLGCTDR